MAKPPKEFHESLRHIVDVERQLSDVFSSSAQADQNTAGTTSDIVTNDPTTTTTTSETTSPVTTTTSDSSSSPVSVTSPATSTSALQASIPASYTGTPQQPGMAPAAPASLAPPPIQTATQSSLPMEKSSKKPNVYADVMQASKILAQTGPGPIPNEAMDYFNKFGGVGSLTPQGLANYGVHPQELAAQQQAPAVPQAVPQVVPAAAPQAAAPSQNPAQYPQAAYGTMAQTGNSYQNRNPYQAAYYDQRGRQHAAPYTRPYRGPKAGGYNPPPRRAYPLNRDELDKSTGDKKAVTAALLFKQGWSANFKDKKSTQSRVFTTEAKRELRRVFEMEKNFKKIAIEKIREDRGKVDVTFTVVFKKKTSKPLKPLYEQIERDHLGNMPVYRDTLFRGEDERPKTAHRKASQMEKSQSENPATEFAEFADKVDRETTGENIPFNEKHEAYQGCFKDKKPNRDMKKHFSKFEMTPEWCVHKCKKEGFTFAGLQYSYLCFCDNKFGKYGRVHDSECSSRCYGDRNRFCGSFWHNSVYSIDGQHHTSDEFSAVEDEPDEEDSEKDRDDDKKKTSDKEEEKEHAKVANHLMAAASSALQAAKKLLPGKNKRQTEEEFTKNEKDAKKALKAVDEIVTDAKNVKKRSAESSDGRGLLMAYLGDVGGYDREYRSAEDEDKPVDKIKFDYKRMIIDEAGDGEFVVKPNNAKHLRRIHRRSLDAEEPDGRKKMASRAVDGDGDAMNPTSAVAEPSRRELLSKDSSDKEIKRRGRDTDEEEEKVEEEEEMARNKKSKSRKRSVGIDKSLYHAKVQEGIESVVSSIVDAMKETSNIGLVKESVEKLSNDVASGLAIAPEQKDQVTNEIKKDIGDTGTARVNSLVTSIRTELNEYGEMHPAIGPQADEAAKSISDLPLDDAKAEEIKKKIRKRSLDESEEADANKEQAFLSDILNEHFKLNP